MFTLITWLTWPRELHLQGLTLENLEKLRLYVNGPDYTKTICIDFIILIGLALLVYIYMWYKEVSSKNKG